MYTFFGLIMIMITKDFFCQVESCLRLLKKFSPKNVGPKTLGCGDDDFKEEQQVKFGKQREITDQLVELPIEHQIFDMIDAAGSEGLTVMEVCALISVFTCSVLVLLL